MEYSSLNFGCFETRFLRLDAPIGDEADQLLRFDIEIGSISNPPGFQALSYCWGKELGKTEIWVSGTKINVSTNLEAALRFSGLAVGTRIWVDAICINQNDLYEKSYQVKMMGQIYSNASKVIPYITLCSYQNLMETPCIYHTLTSYLYPRTTASQSSVHLTSFRHLHRSIRERAMACSV